MSHTSSIFTYKYILQIGICVCENIEYLHVYRTLESLANI